MRSLRRCSTGSHEPSNEVTSLSKFTSAPHEQCRYRHRKYEPFLIRSCVPGTNLAQRNRSVHLGQQLFLRRWEYVSYHFIGAERSGMCSVDCWNETASSAMLRIQSDEGKRCVFWKGISSYPYCKRKIEPSWAIKRPSCNVTLQSLTDRKAAARRKADQKSLDLLQFFIIIYFQQQVHNVNLIPDHILLLTLTNISPKRAECSLHPTGSCEQPGLEGFRSAWEVTVGEQVVTTSPWRWLETRLASSS